MALSLWLLVSVGGRRSQCLKPSATLGSLGPSHFQPHKSQASLRGPLCAHRVSGIPYGEVYNNKNVNRCDIEGKLSLDIDFIGPSIARTIGFGVGLPMLWAYICFEGHFFLAWPASTNFAAVTGFFRDLLESISKDTKSVASCWRKALSHYSVMENASASVARPP